MRRKFNPAQVCSSENYEESKQAHREFIRRFHSENIEEIQHISESIVISQKCYVKCFGRLIEITEIEATRIEETIKIIRK